MSFGLVRVRGDADTPSDVDDTLDMLNLGQVNAFTVVPEDDTYTGMVQKVNDYVAYGEPNAATVAVLLENRGETVEGGEVDDAYASDRGYDGVAELAEAVVEGETTLRDEGVNPTVRLHPPRKGHDGINQSYKQGGVLGNHGDDIDELLRRMR
jgi:large subunit ribosomal protein L30